MGPETEVGGNQKPQNAPGAIPAGTTVWPDGAQGATQWPAELVAQKVKAAASKTESVIPELSFGPIVMGVVLGIVFGASSLYLALKVGMTVSASIPVAVLSITLFRGLSKVLGLRRATILENNIVQTTGSAGESIAFGVAVTMPALLILGYEMELSRIMIVAVLGGLLGVLMMIPLRHALIEESGKELTFP